MRRRELLVAATLLPSCQKQSELPELGSIPAFELTNQDGVLFSSSQLQGKVWVVDFFFTNCPGPCPRMANQLKRIQQESSMLANLMLISITVDPDRDNPEVLAAYARRYQAIPGRWTFLTGSKDSIRTLMTDGFMLGYADNLQEHSTRFVLVDGNMKIRGFYDSFAKDSIYKLLEDIRTLHGNT